MVIAKIPYSKTKTRYLNKKAKPINKFLRKEKEIKIIGKSLSETRKEKNNITQTQRNLRKKITKIIKFVAKFGQKKLVVIMNNTQASKIHISIKKA